MVKYCVAFGCKELQQKGSGIQFHRFPHSRPELLQKWIHAIHRADWAPSKHSAICSKHFTKQCYKVRQGDEVRRLKEDAVPSIFNFPLHVQKQIKDEKRQLVQCTSTISKHEEKKMDTDLCEVEQKCHKAVQTDKLTTVDLMNMVELPESWFMKDEEKEETLQIKVEPDVTFYTNLKEDELNTNRGQQISEPTQVKVEPESGSDTSSMDQDSENSYSVPVDSNIATLREFMCDVCGESFPSYKDQAIHMKSHEPNIKCKCTVCGKLFANKKSLLVHYKTHTGQKLYKCDSCGKTFTHGFSLAAHIRIHTGEKPFKCLICGKMYASSSSLSLHSKSHGTEKPFKCTVCNRMFFYKHYLTAHMKTHTSEKPFKCTVCSLVFSRQSHLSDHTRTHTGEKPFSCTTCGKMFTHSSSLLAHDRTHTGEKPYMCDVCGKLFSGRSYLTKHVRIHSKI